MHALVVGGNFKVRVAVVVAALAAALLALSAGPAMAAPGTYTVSGTSGASFHLLSKGNLVNGQADDQLYYLSASDTGKNKLPFAIHFYNQTYKKMAISTNGNIQVGASPASPGNIAFSNNCLPTTTFTKPVIMPFWDDLSFDSNDLSHGFKEGIFRQVSGKAPHRKFAINWQGSLTNSGPLVLIRVVFKEGSQNIHFIYGTNGGGDATVGVQSGGLNPHFTQYTCNSGSTTAVQSGLNLTFTHSG